MLLARVQTQSQMWQAQLKMRGDRIEELRRQFGEAQVLIGELGKKNEALQEEIAELKRTEKRQATPFARRKRKKKRQRPRRKAGKGGFSHREKPSEEEVDESKEAELPCFLSVGDGGVGDVKEHEHFEVDFPAVKAVVRRYVTHSGYLCRVWGTSAVTAS